eukprot:8812447-Lingulodinium_polyedra.AAC.1
MQSDSTACATKKLLLCAFQALQHATISCALRARGSSPSAWRHQERHNNKTQTTSKHQRTQNKAG